MSNDKLDLIYDIIKEEREQSSEFRKEVRENNYKLQEKLTKIEVETGERLSKIESLDEIQNNQLADHIRRTELLEELHKDNEMRISNLEIPVKTLTTISIWASWIAAIAGAIYALSNILK